MRTAAQTTSRLAVLTTALLAAAAARAQFFHHFDARSATAPLDRPAGDPGNSSSEALFARGAAALDAGRFSEAQRDLLEALARQPQRWEIALKLAQAQNAGGDRPGATRRLMALVDANPADRACREATARIADGVEAWNVLVVALAPYEKTLPADLLEIYAAALGQLLQTQRAEELLRARAHASNAEPRVQFLWIDWLQKHAHTAQALQEITRIESQAELTPELHELAAQIHYDLGQLVGAMTEMSVPDGEPGQFRSGWLLLERKSGGVFTCCPRASAVFQIRCALDGGRATPRTWLLAARIWRRLGNTAVAYELLRSHEPALVDGHCDEALALLSELALTNNHPSDYLQLMRLRAADPAAAAARDELMYMAHLALSEYYAAHGDDALYLDSLRRALEIKSENAELVLDLADREQEAGRPAAARRWFLRVLELNPWHTERKRILEQLGGAEVPGPTATAPASNSKP